MARFDIIQTEWQKHAPALADWAMNHLINRKDVWGQYAPLKEKEKRTSKRGYRAMTLPQKALRNRGDMVTIEKLQRHFSARRVNHIIGLHCRSREGTSRWFGIDIDLHDPDIPNYEEALRRNESCAIAWWEKLQKLGYDPMLFDTNGGGGYHIWTLFAEPAPTEDIYAFSQEIIRDWEERGLDGAPEVYPKGDGLERVDPKTGDEKLGAWFRLPGRHHTRQHFHILWSGESWLDRPWLEGEAAIEVILENQPGPAPPPADPDAEPVERPSDSAPGARSAGGGGGFAAERPTICLDFDGVLARYSGFKGKQSIGDPIDGSIAFTRQLHQTCKIVIYSGRIQSEEDRDAVETWLKRHRYAFDEIHTGGHKPRAHAYVDDRAVPCRPQEDLDAFKNATADLERLLGKNLID